MRIMRMLAIMIFAVISIYGFVVKSFPLFCFGIAIICLAVLWEYIDKYVCYCKVLKYGTCCRAVLVDCSQVEASTKHNLLHGETYELAVRLGDRQYEVRGAFDKPPCEVGTELDVMLLDNIEYVVLPEAIHKNSYFSHILIRVCYILMCLFLVGLYGYLRIYNMIDFEVNEISDV